MPASGNTDLGSATGAVCIELLVRQAALKQDLPGVESLKLVMMLRVPYIVTAIF